MDAPLMTLREVSELTRTPEGTLYYLRSIGQGPKSGRLGKRVVYRRADVLAWIDSAFAA